MLKTIRLFYNYIFNIFIMSKKNLFLVAAGYVVWGLISSIYNKKKPWELEKEIKESKEKWEGEFKILFNDFIDTHKNLLENLKQEDFYKNSKVKLWEKKEELFKIVDVYKTQWIELLDELKVKWKDYLIETSDKLEKLYQEKKVEIESLKEVAPEKMTEIKDKLIASFDEIKEKINKEEK
jgi:hypothetical protein